MADRDSMSLDFIVLLGLIVEEGIGGEVGEREAAQGLKAGDAAGGVTVDYEDAVTVGGEHRDDEAQEVGEAVEAIEIEIVTPSGKARETTISVSVEKQGHVELKTTQAIGPYRGDKANRANRSYGTSG